MKKLFTLVFITLLAGSLALAQTSGNGNTTGQPAPGKNPGTSGKKTGKSTSKLDKSTPKLDKSTPKTTGGKVKEDASGKRQHKPV